MPPPELVDDKTPAKARAATAKARPRAAKASVEAPPPSAAMQRSAAVIDRFLDGLWLEDGLAKNSLAAYRRDLTLFAAWLSEAQARDLSESRASDVQGYMLARHAGSKATSANRRLAVFRRFYRWGLRERLVTEDPTLKLRPARQAMRVPKTLSEAPVRAGRLAARVTREHVALHVARARLREVARLGVREPGREQRQVAPVGRQRVLRQAVLQPQAVEEAVDHALAALQRGRRRQRRRRGGRRLRRLLRSAQAAPSMPAFIFASTGRSPTKMFSSAA